MVALVTAAVLAGQIVDLQIAAAAALVRCPKEVESEMRSRWRDIDGMVKRICVDRKQVQVAAGRGPPGAWADIYLEDIRRCRRQQRPPLGRPYVPARVRTRAAL